jgi:DnaK suppressor protein
MAKNKPDPRKSAKAKAVKPAVKPVAKGKAVAAKKAAKPAPAKKVAKAVKAPVRAAAKPPARKAAPAKPAKPVKKVAKPVPVKPAAVAKPVAAKVAPASAKPKPVADKAADQTRNFVTTSKPATAKSSKKAETAVENGVTMQDGRYALPATVQIDLPGGYKPSSKEEYMSPRQLQFFRNKLSTWREELVEDSRQTIESLRDEVRDVGDEAERATRETENSLELRTRDRYRKLIAKIDKALKRIEEGRYGFCEETDEEIGVDRLDARPIATLSLDAQERWEHRQKQMGD